MKNERAKLRTNKRAKRGREFFVELIEHYDDECPEGLETRNLASTYRKIRPEEWPSWIHYEIIDYPDKGEIGINIHVEERSNQPLEMMLGGIIPKLDKEIGNYDFEGYPNWRGNFRIEGKIHQDEGKEVIACAMLKMIEITKEDIEKLI